jgi:hypothetical protein
VLQQSRLRQGKQGVVTPLKCSDGRWERPSSAYSCCKHAMFVCYNKADSCKANRELSCHYICSDSRSAGGDSHAHSAAAGMPVAGNEMVLCYNKVDCCKETGS